MGTQDQSLKRKTMAVIMLTCLAVLLLNRIQEMRQLAGRLWLVVTPAFLLTDWPSERVKWLRDD